MKLGIKAAGVVVAIGTAVTTMRPGDAVYGMAMARPMDYAVTPGFCSEYAVGREDLFLPKPAHVPFEDAAALLGNVLTAVQSIELGMRLLGVDSLQGKTVFVPGALSATGSAGVQLLKAAYGAEKVISTVSTPKVPLVDRYLPTGTVDQVVDYKTTKRLTDAVPAGSVDFVYNTQWALASAIPLLNRDRGVVVSVASIPPPSLLRQMMRKPLPFYVLWAAGLVQWWYAWKLWGTNVKLDFVSGNAGVREDLEKAGEMIALGKVRALANVVKLDDIGAVREACEKVYAVKGGIGSLVVKIV